MSRTQTSTGVAVFIVMACCMILAVGLVVTEGPRLRERDAIQGAATAQVVEATSEAGRIEATVVAENIQAELTRYVTHAELSPVLTRQAILNNDLEKQLHMASRITPAQQRGPNWIVLAFGILAVSGVASYAIYEWAKTQRECETVIVRTPIAYREDIEIGV